MDYIYSLPLWKNIRGTLSDATDLSDIVEIDTTTDPDSVKDIAGNTLASNKLGLAGVSMFDMWRLNTNFTGTSAPITSNLERVDTDGFSVLGTGMSELSGVFTFPENGTYVVIFDHTFVVAGDDSTVLSEIFYTADDTNWDRASRSGGSINQVSTNSTWQTNTTYHSLRVTDTTQQKVRFHVTVNNGSTSTSSNTGFTVTGMTFIRIGD